MENLMVFTITGQICRLLPDLACTATWLLLRHIHVGATGFREKELHVHVPHHGGHSSLHPPAHTSRVRQDQVHRVADRQVRGQLLLHHPQPVLGRAVPDCGAGCGHGNVCGGEPNRYHAGALSAPTRPVCTLPFWYFCFALRWEV